MDAKVVGDVIAVIGNAGEKLIAPIFALVGVWLGQKLARGRSLEEARREAYSNVISNLDVNFRSREAEEIERILGRAILLADPELQVLLKDYRGFILPYKKVVAPALRREAENGPMARDEWVEAEKTMRMDQKFKHAIRTIEILMRKEIGVKIAEHPKVYEAHEIFESLRRKINDADALLRNY